MKTRIQSLNIKRNISILIVSCILYSPDAIWAQTICPGNVSNLDVRLRVDTGSQNNPGPIVSCVEPGEQYRLEILGQSGNSSYCTSALSGFSLQSATSDGVCRDATNGNLVLPSPVPTAIVNQPLAGLGIQGRVTPNLGRCSNPPSIDFELPPCDPADCEGLPNNAVAWWKFDESSSNSAVDSINDNDGTLINSPLRVSGIVSNALDFDGVNDYVSVPDNNQLDFGFGDLSIEAWIRTSDTNGIIVSKRTPASGSNPFIGYLFMVNSSRLLVQLADSNSGHLNYHSNTVINDNQWHHVAVSIDRNVATGGRIYIDGVNVFTFNPTSRSGNISNSGALTIGRVSESNNNFLDGQIDEVTLYDRALSAAEINAIFNADSSGKCSNSAGPDPLNVELLGCLILNVPFSNATALCFAEATGGTGNYQYNWDYLGNGIINGNGNEATILECSGTGTAIVTVSDGPSIVSAFSNVSCPTGGGFGGFD